MKLRFGRSLNTVYFLFALAICIAAITTAIVINAKLLVKKVGKITKVKGGKIHWVESGQGRPIIMIHGLAGNLRNFTFALTSKLNKEFKVIAIDRAGCGCSYREDPNYAKLSEQARMIAEFIKAEALERPVIVGHSLGGAIALTLAFNHRETVGALALVCPVTQPIFKIHRVFRALNISKSAMRLLIAYTLAPILGALTERRTLIEVFAPEPVPKSFTTRGGGRASRSPKGFITASEDLVFALFSSESFIKLEKELPVPTGILFGAADHILDPTLHGENFSAQTGAKLTLLPEKGHMILVTAPDECAEFVRDIASKI